MKKYVGIDVSYKDFNMAMPLNSDYQEFTSTKFLNNEDGIALFIAQLQKEKEVHCILEATGNYSLLLTYQLIEEGIPVSVINPKSSSHFRKLLLKTTKTDDIDSQLLALYGRNMQPKEFEPKSEATMQLKQQRSVLNQLQKTLMAQKNVLHALEVHPFQDPFSIEQTKKMIEFAESQLVIVKAKMTEIAKVDFEECYEYVISVKGVGDRVAAALIEVTGGFTMFEDAKPLAKFLGISPTYYESGTSIKIKGQINRSGDPKLRALLYIASWSAIRFNRPCKELYHRLKAAGKPSKVALIAVMNKMLRQVFAVVKNKRKFDNDWGKSQAATTVEQTPILVTQ